MEFGLLLGNFANPGFMSRLFEAFYYSLLSEALTSKRKKRLLIFVNYPVPRAQGVGAPPQRNLRRFIPAAETSRF